MNIFAFKINGQSPRCCWWLCEFRSISRNTYVVKRQPCADAGWSRMWKERAQRCVSKSSLTSWILLKDIIVKGGRWYWLVHIQQTPDTELKMRIDDVTKATRKDFWENGEWVELYLDWVWGPIYFVWRTNWLSFADTKQESRRRE